MECFSQCLRQMLRHMILNPSGASGRGAACRVISSTAKNAVPFSARATISLCAIIRRNASKALRAKCAVRRIGANVSSWRTACRPLARLAARTEEDMTNGRSICHLARWQKLRPFARRGIKSCVPSATLFRQTLRHRGGKAMLSQNRANDLSLKSVERS